MDKYEFSYYFSKESEQFSFYRIPKLLFSDEYFKGMSCEAKVLYGLMLDRMGLSAKNGWTDEQGRVYIVFTKEDVMSYLNCKSEKAMKLLGELYDIGLAEKVRLGRGKPNRIYVKNFIGVKRERKQEDEPGIEKFENRTTRSSEIEPQEVRKSNCNNTKYNNTEYNNISIIPINPIVSNGRGVIDRMDSYRQVIRTNIDYAAKVLHDGCYRREEVDELVELMVDVMVLDDRATVRINGQNVAATIVKAQFLKIRWGHVEYVLSEIRKATSRINNIRAYLLTALYNAPMTLANFYASEIAFGG